MLDDSRTDLDAAVSDLAVAVGEVQRFVAGTRDKTAEQVQRLANVTQVLADHRMDLENILHVAPTAFANSYNIINPNLPGGIGTFIINNFSNPVEFICARNRGVENTTAPETAKLCAQYLGPALRLLNFNTLPSPPLNPFLAPAVTPDKMRLLRSRTGPRRSGRPPGRPSSFPRCRPTPGRRRPATGRLLHRRAATTGAGDASRPAAARRSPAPGGAATRTAPAEGTPPS